MKFSSGKTRDNDTVLVILTMVDDDVYEEAQELAVSIDPTLLSSVAVIGSPDNNMECLYPIGVDLIPCNNYTILDNNG